MLASFPNPVLCKRKVNHNKLWPPYSPWLSYCKEVGRENKYSQMIQILIYLPLWLQLTKVNGRNSQRRYVLENCASTTKPSSSSSWSSEARIAQGTSLSHPPNLRPGKKEGVLPLFKYFTKSITFQILPQSDIFPTHNVNLWTFWALGRSRGLRAQPIWWPVPIGARGGRRPFVLYQSAHLR